MFAGGANRALAAAVVRQLGANLGNCSVDRFPDGEVAVQLLESVRRKEVFLVQSIAPPVNDHLVELLAPPRCHASSPTAPLATWVECRRVGRRQKEDI